MKKFLTRLHIFLSHHSFLYALIAGVGIVLFWRGVWHTTDLVHLYMSNSQAVMDHTWWDGPLSFLTGCLILYITRAFVSSFIGNELILSGLRTEKKNDQTGNDRSQRGGHCNLRYQTRDWDNRTQARRSRRPSA